METKKLTDDFSEDEPGFEYRHYLHQVVMNGQLSSYKETLMELSIGSLIDWILLVAPQTGPHSVWTGAVRDEIKRRTYIAKEYRNAIYQRHAEGLQ